MTDYDDILQKINKIIINKGYTIVTYIEDETYMFEIQDNSIVASYIQIYNSINTITEKYTQKEIETNTFHISSLSTDVVYRGQGLALLLLIYGICYLKIQFPDVNYATLDDDSDKNIEMINIYNSIGFIFRDSVALDIMNPKKVIPSGPEKQLLINEEFIRRANYQLDKKFIRNKTNYLPIGKIKPSREKSISIKTGPYNKEDRTTTVRIGGRKKQKYGKYKKGKTKKYKRKLTNKKY